jgi:hypothetical protein
LPWRANTTHKQPAKQEEGKRMLVRTMTALVAVAFAIGCTPAAPKAEAPAEAASTGCADDGPRFPDTNICEGRASNYINPELVAETRSPPGGGAPGCAWKTNQTMLADQAVLYEALSCNGKTAKLAYAGGARSASLTLETAALGAPGAELVRVFTSDPADPQASIRALIADAPAAERSKCEVQPAGRADWPKDALVITYKKAFQRELSPTEAESVCGRYGLDEGAQSYWLVRGGYAWFVTLGNDAPEIDAGTITLLRKGADGSWAAAE